MHPSATTNKTTYPPAATIAVTVTVTTAITTFTTSPPCTPTLPSTTVTTESNGRSDGGIGSASAVAGASASSNTTRVLRQRPKMGGGQLWYRTILRWSFVAVVLLVGSPPVQAWTNDILSPPSHPRFFHTSQSSSSYHPPQQRPKKRTAQITCFLSIDDDSDDDSSSSSSTSGSSSSMNNGCTEDAGWTNDDDSKNENNQKTLPPQNIAALAETKLKLIQQAQAKIDSILQCPVDPPFDAEKEFSKVISVDASSFAELNGEGSSTSTSTLTQQEAALEQKVYQMEEALYQSIQETDYTKAAQHASALDQFHLDDCGLVLQANSLYYKAFSYKDIEEMKRVWLPDRSCICIHPSHPPISGAHAILNSWSNMFQSKRGAFQRTWMEPSEIRLTVKAHMAILTCEEHVYSRVFIRGQKRQDQLEQKLQATNIFRKVNGKWYLTYHHASWHPESEASKRALGKSTGNAGNKKKSGNDSGNGGKKVLGLSSPNRNNGGRSGKEEDDDASKMTEFDKIMGIPKFGPLLGDESKSGGKDDEKPVKRVIMGSLSDLLNGNLGGLLGDDDDLDDDEEDDDDDDDDLSDGMIHFGSEHDDDSDEEEEEDDDDDDDEDRATLEWSRHMKNRRRPRRKASSGAIKKLTNGNSSPKVTAQSLKQEEENRRQGCIFALRKLSSEGRISPKQKRALLTDIISCSARGELSMVEVAYDLLYIGEKTVHGGNDKDNDTTAPSVVDNVDSQSQDDDAEDEFADQCIAFAQSLDVGDNLYRR